MSERRTPIAPDLHVNRYSQAVPRPRKVHHLYEQFTSPLKLMHEGDMCISVPSDLAGRSRHIMHYQPGSYRCGASEPNTAIHFQRPVPPEDYRVGQSHA